MQATLNVCIGASMLTIPSFTRSLLGDGLVSASAGGVSLVVNPMTNLLKKMPLEIPKFVGQQSAKGFQVIGWQNEKLLANQRQLEQANQKTQ